VCFLPLHAGLRVRRAPGFPCALFLGRKFTHNPGASRRENANAYLVVIAATNAKRLRKGANPRGSASDRLFRDSMISFTFARVPGW